MSDVTTLKRKEDWRLITNVILKEENKYVQRTDDLQSQNLCLTEKRFYLLYPADPSAETAKSIQDIHKYR